MRTPRWIGLTGYAGSGKSYVAQKIIDHGSHFRQRFAYALRDEIEQSLGVEVPRLWEKPTTPEIRRLLQWWGTDWRRQEDEDYWVKKTLAEADEMLTNPHIDRASVVFDDVRFPNEARAVQRRGGLIVRVLAPPEVREARIGKVEPHASETAMDNFPVDMHITSTEENLAFEGQLNRILVEATYDQGMFLRSIAESLRD
jgi:hypothetical protein